VPVPGGAAPSGAGAPLLWTTPLGALAAPALLASRGGGTKAGEDVSRLLDRAGEDASGTSDRAEFKGEQKSSASESATLPEGLMPPAGATVEQARDGASIFLAVLAILWLAAAIAYAVRGMRKARF